MIYDLSNEIDKQRSDTRYKQLRAKGKRIELTDKQNRTLSQNSYLHLIICWFAIETGNTIDYVKREYYKKVCNAELYIKEKEDELLHKKVKYLCSSTELNTSDMTTSIERFRNWSSENGIHLPSPEDREFLNYIEQEKAKNRQYI